MPLDHGTLTPPMSDAMTRGVRVEVMARHITDHAPELEGQWVFEYTVRITNQSSTTVQLLSRHWLITDGLEQVREVKGSGVIGQQPVLKPQEQFQYSSWCPLPTPTGMMRGSYRMLGDAGEEFDIEVAPFGLRARYSVQ